MAQLKAYLVILLILVVLIVLYFILAPSSWQIWNNSFYSESSTPQQIKKVACTHSWKCDWGPCVNGSQSQIAVDVNNCKAPITGQIACPALARVCTK